MKGIIIDGVAASGKTTILKHLHDKISQTYPSSTKFFISEHYTERMLEHLKERGELNGLHIKSHVAQIIQSIATYQTMLDNSKFSSNPKGADIFITLERFLLTHFASTDDIENTYDLEEARSHFEILNKLGIQQIALVMPESKLKDNIISTLNYRNNQWKEHLYSRGNEQEIIAYYLNWQNKFLYYIDKFKNHIDIKVIEIKDNNYTGYANFIFNSCIMPDTFWTP